jgi:hypothetical protein
LAGQRGAAPAHQQAEAVLEPREQLVDRQEADAGGGQLDRQRDAVQAAAQLDDRARVLRGDGNRQLNNCAPLDI